MSNDDFDDDDPKPTRDARGRWLPGHCPNPRGRPKKRLSVLTDQGDTHIFANTAVEVKIQGQMQLMTRGAALMLKAYEGAMKGSVYLLRYLDEKFAKNEEMMTEIRVRYDELVLDWIVNNPDRHRPGYKMPAEVELEMQGMLTFLNHFYPDSYPLSIEPKYDRSAEEEEVRKIETELGL